MLLLEPTAITYIAFVVATIYALPAFGQRVLAFLRDLDDYRANRPRR